jgi:hypothetical protein
LWSRESAFPPKSGWDLCMIWALLIPGVDIFF